MLIMSRGLFTGKNFKQNIRGKRMKIGNLVVPLREHEKCLLGIGFAFNICREQCIKITLSR